jgi:Fe-S-cluster containining protein
MDSADHLAALPSRARARKTEFQTLVKRLRKRRAGEIEQIISRLNGRAFEEISCLDCGNCCRTLGPRLTDRDIQRLAKLLRKSPGGIENEYTRIDEDGDRVFKAMPCPFLGDDNFCAVYDSRPRACAEYPHTEGRQVRRRLDQLARNAEFCPAVFRMLEMLGEELIR